MNVYYKSSIWNIIIYDSILHNLLLFLFQLKRVQTNFILSFQMIMLLWVSTKITQILLMQCAIWEILKVLWKTSNSIWPYIFFFIVHMLKWDSDLVCFSENISQMWILFPGLIFQYQCSFCEQRKLFCFIQSAWKMNWKKWNCFILPPNWNEKENWYNKLVPNSLCKVL